MKRLLNHLILITSGILIGGVIWLISTPPRGTPVTLLPGPTPSPLRIHVTGEVENPGVYELPSGARVIEAIEAAGGLLPGVDESILNMAGVLVDGAQVFVPGTVSTVDNDLESTSAETSAPPTSAFVNINTATLAQLESLPGIGPSIAQRIIDHREANGPFEKAADIVKVSGIGPSTFENIKDFITVDP